MSKKWLIGAIGTAVMATMLLSGCGTTRNDMGEGSGSVTNGATSSTVSTTSSTSVASTTDATTSSTSGGLLDEITNVQ